MPIARFEMPDGRIARFEVPEGTTPEQAQAMISESVGQSQAVQGPPTPDQAEMTDASSRMVRGAMDPVTGLAQLLYNVIPEGVQNAGDWLNNKLVEIGVPLAKIPEGGFNQLVQGQEQQYQQARSAMGQEGIDAYRLAGNMATTVPIAMMAPGASAATLPARAGYGAAVGGAIGATNPVTENTDNFFGEKAKQVGIGAAAGAVATPVAEGLARVIRPATDKVVQSLMREGVTPTPGQILGGFAKFAEEKARSIPILGDIISSGQRRAIVDFNRAAYSRALEPIGIDASKMPVGREGVKAVKNALSRAYNQVLPKVTFKADTQFASEVQSLRQMAHTLPDDVSKQFDAILRRHVISRMTPAGTMSGTTLKQVESQLGSLAKGYRGDASFDKRQLGDAILELQSSIRGVLMRANPEMAEALQKINTGYANYAVIRKAASMANTGEMFTPSQLASAVKAMDKTVGKGATATGSARMQDLSDAGVKTLASKVPDSGTAGRLFLGGGVTYFDPTIAAGLAVSGTPYTQIGQKAMAALLTKRPESFSIAADAVRSSAPAIGAVAGPPLLE